MRLSPSDNIAVALRPLKGGETLLLDGIALTVGQSIAVGHKLAAQAIAAGEVVCKYACPIGVAIRAIAPGEPLDAQNVESRYLPTYTLPG
jgi:altronate hydrolase